MSSRKPKTTREADADRRWARRFDGERIRGRITTATLSACLTRGLVRGSDPEGYVLTEKGTQAANYTVDEDIERIKKLVSSVPDEKRPQWSYRGETTPEKSKAERLRRVALECGDLCASKNEAYGNSYETSCDVLAVIYPNGITVAQYADALPMVRVIDKLFRIANRKGAFGESPWRDILGYALLCTERDERS